MITAYLIACIPTLGPIACFYGAAFFGYDTCVYASSRCRAMQGCFEGLRLSSVIYFVCFAGRVAFML